MLKKIIIGALISMAYHGASVAMDIYNDLSAQQQAQFRSFVASQPPTANNTAIL